MARRRGSRKCAVHSVPKEEMLALVGRSGGGDKGLIKAKRCKNDTLERRTRSTLLQAHTHTHTPHVCTPGSSAALPRCTGPSVCLSVDRRSCQD